MTETPDIQVSFTWRWEDGTPMTDEEQLRARQMVGQRIMGVFEQSEFARRYVAPMLSALQEKGATDEELNELLRLVVKAWAVPERFEAFGAAFQQVYARLKLREPTPARMSRTMGAEPSDYPNGNAPPRA
jgi:hypothetical protein